MENEEKNSVQVLIRLQPPFRQLFKIEEDNTVLKTSGKTFYFDHIFTTSCDQYNVFAKVGTKVINNVLNGYNSCVFVYGQTGSGKTYTMTGKEDEKNQGLIPRCLDSLWDLLQDYDGFEIQFSYLEIYNQQIFDLLSSGETNNIKLRQHNVEGFYVQNLKIEVIQSKNQFSQLLKLGLSNRHKGFTKANSQSSRSHSILTLKVTTKKANENNSNILKISKLHFVDLAGSEKQKSTQAAGERLKQASNINKSLTNLSIVISKLSSQDKNQKHIPYRSSKLTTILKDSLGGNSKTIIIGTISCQQKSYQQTISTLLFMEKAKKIKLNAKVNAQTQGSVQQLKLMIKNLQQELKTLKQSNKGQVTNCQQCEHLKSQSEKISKENQFLSNKITELQSLLNSGQKRPEGSNDITKDSHQTQSNSIDELYQITQQSEQKQVSSFRSFMNENYQINNQNHDDPLFMHRWTKYATLQLQLAKKEHQIEQLKNERENMMKAQQFYEPILKLIEMNIKKFKFTDCQKIILSAQHHKFISLKSLYQAQIKNWKILEEHYKHTINQYEKKVSVQLSKAKTVQSEYVDSIQKHQEINNLNKIIANYKIRIEKLISQNNELQILKRIGQVKSQDNQQIDDLKLQIETIKQTNRFLQQKISSLENSLSHKNQQIEQIHKQVNIFAKKDQKQFQSLLAKIKYLENQITLKVQLLTSKQNYAQQLQQQINKQSINSKKLEQQSHIQIELRRQLLSLTADYEMVLTVNQRLKKQYKQIESSIEQKIILLKNQQQQKNQQLYAKLAQMQKQINELKQNEKKLKLQHEQKVNQIENLLNQIEKLQIINQNTNQKNKKILQINQNLKCQLQLRQKQQNQKYLVSYNNGLLEIQKKNIKIRQLQQMNKSLTESQALFLEQIQKNQTHESLQNQKLGHEYTLLKSQYEGSQEQLKILIIDHEKLIKENQILKLKLTNECLDAKQIRRKYESLIKGKKITNKQIQMIYQDKLDYQQKKNRSTMNLILRIVGQDVSQDDFDLIHKRLEQYVEENEKNREQSILLQKTNEWLKKRNFDYLKQAQNARFKGNKA